jgi:hypothetical protein
MNRQRIFQRFYDMVDREKRYVLAEIMEVKGLLPLLMKPRNHQKWTPQDKHELMTHLRHMSKVSPYIAVIMLPGGLLMLPALSWWLDRRRGKRATAKASRVD